MSEKPREPNESAIPEEVAKLYARARVPGTRYWDFSASRKEVQGQFRDRIEREHAQRAGVEPTVASTRTAMEQIRAAQFQSVPESASPPVVHQVNKFEPIVRSASEAGTPLPAGEGRDARHNSPRDPANNGLLKPPVDAVPMQAQAGPASARWFALQSVFAPEPAASAPSNAPAPGLPERLPAVVVFSLVGGVGKTCLVATLGRVLSAMGERVLLADTVCSGVLPYYFGSRESKPGVVRTFSPPSSVSFLSLPPGNHVAHAPVQLLNLEAKRFPFHAGGQDLLLFNLSQAGRAASRILIDVATANRELTYRLQALDPIVLVPVLPDMNSIASLPALQSYFAEQKAEGGGAKIFYVLNQFDMASALHRDMRDLLHLRLGDRLLPIVLHGSPLVNEALAEGMTVMDYAAESAIAEDYRNLAAWLGRMTAPSIPVTPGVRWRES